MAVTMTASDPLYPEWARLYSALAAYVNATCHWDLRDVPEAERLVEVARLTDEICERFEELER